MLETFWQDLRHGTRMLAKNPGFAAVAMLSIALGVGANAAMFSLADALVLRPLHVPRATEVVALSGNNTAVTSNSGFGVNRNVSYLDYRDVRDRARSFEGLFAYRVVITGFAARPGDAAQQVLGQGVSGNFFRVLGVPPALGRTFRDDEDEAPGRDPVVVLSHDAWTERFGVRPRHRRPRRAARRTGPHGHRRGARQLHRHLPGAAPGLLRAAGDDGPAGRQPARTCATTGASGRCS